MPEFFLELFSEEIPARMQAGAAAELERICRATLNELSVQDAKSFYGPRRIAFAAEIGAEKPGGVIEARGPRDTAPEAALTGFLGKHKAAREELITESGYYWLRRNDPPVPAGELIANALPAALAKFSWPKSMRWGQSGDFTWVRPLRRIICLLDGEIIPIALGPVTAGNETEGHRFLSPGAVAVSSNLDWLEKLRSRNVVVDKSERLAAIVGGLKAQAETLGLTLANDDALLDEVTGLVEWPVPLIGKIGDEFMSLPPEVRELSMKVNQRYFALRDEAGQPAPYFAFVSNIEATDGGATIIAGNERVLRARLSDARISGTSTSKPHSTRCCRNSTPSPSMPKSARKGNGSNAFPPWQPASPKPLAPMQSMAPRPPLPACSARPIWSPSWSASSPNCKASWAVIMPRKIPATGKATSSAPP